MSVYIKSRADIFSFAAHFGCAMEYNYYFMLFMKSVGPLMVLSGIVAIMMLGTFNLSRRTKALLLNAALLFSLTVYTGIYTALFQYFDCRSYEDGEQYLVIEPEIKCTDSAYSEKVPAVGLLCVVVTIGFPLAYWCLLRSHRRGIYPMVLGKFKKLSEDMATANTKVFGFKRKRTLWGKSDSNTTDQQQGAQKAKAVEAAAAAEVSKFWAQQLADILKMDKGDPQLTTTDLDECADLIKRAYTVLLALKGPHSANFWMQECSRGCDPSIESTKFLWGPYYPR